MRFSPRLTHLRATLRLAVPVVVVQLGLRTMGLVDTIMAGHVPGDEVLAAVGLGAVSTFATLIFGMGVLHALDPLVAQAAGSGDGEGIARALQRGLLLCALLTLPIAGLLWGAEPLLRALGQPESIVPRAAHYMRINVLGVAPFLVFVVLRQTLQALRLMRPIVITIVVANLLNVVLDWALIFGHLGFPPLHVEGAAWATTISRSFMAGMLVVVSWPAVGPYLRVLRPGVLSLAPLGRMLQVGVPIGILMQVEFGAFYAVMVFMGMLGVTELAAHQVAINLASTTFMVPLGVSAAGAVLVGQSIGRSDSDGARRFAGASIVLGTGVMCLSGVMFALVPRQLSELFTQDVAVVAMAASLLPIAAMFQLCDGLQVVTGGVLRGAADTRVPMYANLFGFWGVGVPLSWYLGFHTELGPVGMWWGLSAGLLVVSASLLLRVGGILGRDVERFQVDVQTS